MAASGSSSISLVKVPAGPRPTFVKLTKAQEALLGWECEHARVEACTQNAINVRSHVRAATVKPLDFVPMTFTQGQVDHKWKTEVQLRLRLPDGSTRTLRWEFPGARPSIFREGDPVDLFSVRGGFHPPLRHGDVCYREPVPAFVVHRTDDEVHALSPLPTFAGPKNPFEIAALPGVLCAIFGAGLVWIAVGGMLGSPGSLVDLGSVVSYAGFLGVASVSFVGASGLLWLGFTGLHRHRLRLAQWRTVMERAESAQGVAGPRTRSSLS